MDPDLAPRCSRCARRHIAGIPCWAGRYAQRVTYAVLQHYGTVCVHCSKDGADSAEHVTPRSRRGDDSLDNLRPSHVRCNSRRGTKAMRGYGATATVVMGPPRSGKTTWVREHAQRGDIVVDLDVLAAALTVGTDQSAGVPGHVRHVAIGARTEAIKRAVALREQVHVWIVHAIPTPAQRADYIEAGAELIIVDPGEDVVMARCEGNAQALAAARRWYATHMSTPPIF